MIMVSSTRRCARSVSVGFPKMGSNRSSRAAKTEWIFRLHGKDRGRVVGCKAGAIKQRRAIAKYHGYI